MIFTMVGKVQTVVETQKGVVSLLIKDGKAVEIRLGCVFEDVEVMDLKPFKDVLEGYFKGEVKVVDFPVDLRGTDFQKRVWKEVRKIPYGRIITYGELARKLNTSPRAVGMALAKNKLPIYIPCHRVVGKLSIGGFSSGVEWKRFLLELEGVIV